MFTESLIATLDLSPLWISLRISAIATAITVCLGISAAAWMYRYEGRWRSFIDSCFLAPMVLPPTVLGFLLLLLLGRNGPLGTLLERLGLTLIFTWYAAVIAATVVSFPLMYRTVLGALKQIDHNLSLAARTLGGSELSVFWRITLPLALPGVLAGTTLSFARALGEFGATLMLAGNIPGQTQTIPMAIFFAVEAGDFQEAFLWTSIILAIAFAGLVVMHQWHRGVDRKSQLNNVSKGFRPWRSRKQAPFFDSLPVSQIHSQAQNATNTNKVSLQVTLLKRLPGFTLDVSLSIDDQPLGLLGASGAGKSLILRCIAGIEIPDEGLIVLNGRVLFDSVRGINVPIRDRKVGVLFQNYALFPHLTIAENIAFGIPPNLPERQREQIVEQQLTAVQLQGFGERYPTTLSGGQQQRAAMARVLATKPEVLLLDEPFSALDTHLRYVMERDLRGWLETFSGVTLLITHNIEEAYRICQNLLVMERGRVDIIASKYDVLSQPRTVNAARLTGCKNISRAVYVDSSTIRALDWDYTLTVARPLNTSLTHVGVRAHQLRFLDTTFSLPTVPIDTRERQDGSDELTSQIEELQNQEWSSAQEQRTKAYSSAPINTFLCWPTMMSETPHRMTIYLKLHETPTHSQDYHLQAEIFKDRWAVIKEMPLPWSVVLSPEQLLLLYNPQDPT
ncbi:MAG: molybdate ABC transporter permease subunit [Cyanobacteria bacterium P01_H01_bin.15]